MRETLFNWLGQDLGKLVCLDLFAGSGALGFEAASRGASLVVMVERDPVALQALYVNRARFGAEAAVQIVARDAINYLAHETRCFDVVFLDPPFRQNAIEPLLKRLPARLGDGARVYVEASAPLAVELPWRELKRARAGQVSYQLLQWSQHDPSRVPGHI